MYSAPPPRRNVRSPGRGKRPKSIRAPPIRASKTPRTRSRRPASCILALQQASLLGAGVGRPDAHVSICQFGGNSAAGGSGQEADLDQVRLVHRPPLPPPPPPPPPPPRPP